MAATIELEDPSNPNGTWKLIVDGVPAKTGLTRDQAHIELGNRQRTTGAGAPQSREVTDATAIDVAAADDGVGPEVETTGPKLG